MAEKDLMAGFSAVGEERCLEESAGSVMLGNG